MFGLRVAQMTDAVFSACKHLSMTNPSSPRVASADRMDGGLIITFEDGQCGIYSAALLLATLPQAEHVEPEGNGPGQRPRS